MSILLFGMSGQLGQALLEQATQPVTAPDRTSADLAHPSSIRAIIETVNPCVMINAAAYNFVDRAESEPELCDAINHRAVAVMAEEAAKRGIRFITFSTDYVFDGKKASAYTEEDEPNPLNVYGRSKLDGEQAALATGHLVLRTSWLYSDGPANFPAKMIVAAKSKPSLKVVDDQVGAPTTARDLAHATYQILAEHPDLYGLYHCTAQGETSRYGWAKAILETAGINTDITPIKTADWPAPAARPLNSRLSCEKLLRDTGIQLPCWDDALRTPLRQ